MQKKKGSTSHVTNTTEKKILDQLAALRADIAALRVELIVARNHNLLPLPFAGHILAGMKPAALARAIDRGEIPTIKINGVTFVDFEACRRG